MIMSATTLTPKDGTMEIYQGAQDTTKSESSCGIDLVIEHLDEFSVGRAAICQLTNADYVVYATAS
jgi:hypothetical protein